MTRKDYRLIASAVANIGYLCQRKIAADELIRVLGRDNPRFKPNVFLIACDAVVTPLREKKL